ncbi:MAG: 5-formyltetrahydrofolate cyclo-ligase [Nitrospira sp.]|nr:5-formyltetrahydrofolate cyclo-ligase [Nitrospira sp.]
MKKRLRSKLLKQRDSIPPLQRDLKEEAIENRLFQLDIFKKARGILLYVSFRSEVDTRQFLDNVIKLNKNLVLPTVDSSKNVLLLYHVKSSMELKSGYMGICEPGITVNREATLQDVDLVIIPGTGFDTDGNRLGYGGGYYDRLLSIESKRLAQVEHIPTVALAFEEQIGEEIPAEPHDIKVDIIITDERTIYC